jgi:hypothetical protein
MIAKALLLYQKIQLLHIVTQGSTTNGCVSVCISLTSLLLKVGEKKVNHLST